MQRSKTGNWTPAADPERPTNHKEITLREYQQTALETAIYPDVGENIVYPALGLAGEAGEVANQVKKIIRDDEGALTADRAETIISELGDVLWYAAAIANELGITLEDVARINIRD